MNATGWKGATYGVRVGLSNAIKFFDKEWDTVEIEIDGDSTRSVYRLNSGRNAPKFEVQSSGNGSCGKDLRHGRFGNHRNWN